MDQHEAVDSRLLLAIIQLAEQVDLEQKKFDMVTKKNQLIKKHILDITDTMAPVDDDVFRMVKCKKELAMVNMMSLIRTPLCCADIRLGPATSAKRKTTRGVKRTARFDPRTAKKLKSEKTKTRSKAVATGDKLSKKLVEIVTKNQNSLIKCHSSVSPPSKPKGRMRFVTWFEGYKRRQKKRRQEKQITEIVICPHEHCPNTFNSLTELKMHESLHRRDLKPSSKKKKNLERLEKRTLVDQEQSKPKRGRPKKVVEQTRNSTGETKLKKKRGRPKKVIRLKKEGESKKRGRCGRPRKIKPKESVDNKHLAVVVGDKLVRIEESSDHCFVCGVRFDNDYLLKRHLLVSHDYWGAN